MYHRRYVFVFQTNSGFGPTPTYESYDINAVLKEGYFFEFEDSSDMYRVASIYDYDEETSYVVLKRVKPWIALFNRLRWCINGDL